MCSTEEPIPECTAFNAFNNTANSIELYSCVECLNSDRGCKGNIQRNTVKTYYKINNYISISPKHIKLKYENVI